MDEKKFKATLRIPTQTQYAYLEIVVEGTPKEIVADYLSIQDTYQRAQKKWDADKPPF